MNLEDDLEDDDGSRRRADCGFVGACPTTGPASQRDRPDGVPDDHVRSHGSSSSANIVRVDPANRNTTGHLRPLRAQCPARGHLLLPDQLTVIRLGMSQ